MGYLQESMFDMGITNIDRQTANVLFDTILDDEFLFLLHMHYDLHESILGELNNIFMYKINPILFSILLDSNLFQ